MAVIEVPRQIVPRHVRITDVPGFENTGYTELSQRPLRVIGAHGYTQRSGVQLWTADEAAAYRMAAYEEWFCPMTSTVSLYRAQEIRNALMQAEEEERVYRVTPRIRMKRSLEHKFRDNSVKAILPRTAELYREYLKRRGYNSVIIDMPETLNELLSNESLVAVRAVGFGDANGLLNIISADTNNHESGRARGTFELPPQK
ncbi:hypothetical protein J4457_06615 [Candidatus Woesearchaeota archaeon]|nr:hypothetical protein [Candidatus Woesearchaeota archaeon]